MNSECITTSAHHSPCISVIMPVYNCEHYLREAIDSILAQTFTDFELLIIDDGSTDRSIEIARSCTDDRIHVLSEPHRGLVATLNKGLALARGTYVARMDADDISSPRRFARQIALLESHADVVLVGCCARCIDTEGRAAGNYVMPPPEGRSLAVALCGSNQFVHGSIMARREAILSVGGYRREFLTAEDYDLWLRLGEIGCIVNIPQWLYQLRIHRSSKSAHEGERRRRDCTMKAQRYALQRRLYGRDDLGYASPLCPESALSAVMLSDWAQIYLWQGQLRTGADLLRRAFLREVGSAHAWSIVPPTYVSKPYVREIFRSIQCGTFLELAGAVARRLVDRVR